MGATLLVVICCVLLHTLLRVVACCWELLHKVRHQSNVAQQCWIHNAKLFQHCLGHARALKSYGLYPSYADALQVLTLLGVGVSFAQDSSP